MSDKILVLYGSYRADRVGIRLADFIVRGLAGRGAAPELIDAKAINLPMLDRMYKEHAPGTAPPTLENLAQKIHGARLAIGACYGNDMIGLPPGISRSHECQGAARFGMQD